MHCPITIGLGNHDDRDQFRKAFSIELTEVQKAAQRHVVVIESGHATWLVLDSLMYVNKTAVTWARPANVAQELSGRGVGEIGKAILIMVHHTLGDNDGELMDASSLLAMSQQFRK